MDTPMLREKVASYYPGTDWKKRVQKMPYKQLYAIWRRKEEEKVRKKKEADEAAKSGIVIEEEPNKKPEEPYHQMAIWEWVDMLEKNTSE